MKMIIILMTVAVLFVTISSLHAQRREFDIEKRIQHLKTELKLTTDQEKNIKEIMEEYNEKMDELFDSRNGDRRELRDKMREIRDDLNEEIKSELNEDQIKKYEEILKNQKNNFKRNKNRIR